jgi:hypothetical protein
MAEREQKRRVHRQESQLAQHVFSQIDKGAKGNCQVHGGAVLNSRARGPPIIDCKHLSLLRKGITSCVWQIESRLIGGRAVRAPTLERATFNVGSKPNGSRAKRAYIAGKLLCLRSKPTAVTANEGIDIAGELLNFCFCQQANSGHGQQGHRHCGQVTNLFTASQMAVTPQGL